MKNILIVLCAAMAVACGGRAKTNSTEVTPENTAKKKIEMPKMPTVFSSDEERGEYMAMHFWDNYDFADTSYIDLPEITEQYFADYINLLNHLQSELGVRSITAMMDKAEGDTLVYEHFCELYDKYLYDPNSPMRNEELYISVLHHIIASERVDDLEKIRPQHRLTMALKNRIGTKAVDITFTMASGKNMRLYDVKSDFTLLYINNPDCTACREISGGIQASSMLMPLIRQGVLKVVMVYPDEDIEAWRKHLSEVPVDWINGYDRSTMMRNKDLYDLKAIPTLYLLDKNKNVLIKDAAAVVPLEYYFESIGF